MLTKRLLPFLILSSLNIMGIIIEIEWLRIATKPLLIPALVFFYVSHNPKPDRGVLIALFFSFLGDLFLLGVGTSFFLLGLGNFLATQIIFTLKMGERIQKKRLDLLKASLPYLIYSFVLLYLLIPSLGELAPAVLVYALAICSFGILSLTYFLQRLQNGSWIACGALLFVLSDSMIALNQFYFQKDFFGPGVMLTYLTAQLFIVLFFKKEALALKK